MEAIVGFSRAVRMGPFVTIGGTAPVDENGKTVGVGDVGAQTRALPVYSGPHWSKRVPAFMMSFAQG